MKRLTCITVSTNQIAEVLQLRRRMVRGLRGA